MSCFKYAKPVFGFNLDDFWTDNYHGFQVGRFDTEVLKLPPRTLLKARLNKVKALFGTAGVDLYKDLQPRVFPKRKHKPRKKLTALPPSKIAAIADDNDPADDDDTLELES